LLQNPFHLPDFKEVKAILDGADPVKFEIEDFLLTAPQGGEQPKRFVFHGAP
jgi:hypothetical protein